MVAGFPGGGWLAGEWRSEWMNDLAGSPCVQYLACDRTISIETMSVKQYSAYMVFTLSAHNPGEERGIA
jgi:hypothetical protein